MARRNPQKQGRRGTKVNSRQMNQYTKLHSLLECVPDESLLPNEKHSSSGYVVGVLDVRMIEGIPRSTFVVDFLGFYR